MFADLPAGELALQQDRDRPIRSVPELRARMLDEFAKNPRPFAEIVAERVGRRPDDPAVRTLAGAVIGEVIGVGSGAWYTAGDRASPRDHLAVMDASLAQLEAGLPL